MPLARQLALEATQDRRCPGRMRSPMASSALWRDEARRGGADLPGFSTRSPSITTAFSIDPPAGGSPMARSASTSCAGSRRCGSRRVRGGTRPRPWAGRFPGLPITAVGNSMAKATSKPHGGTQRRALVAIDDFDGVDDFDEPASRGCCGRRSTRSRIFRNGQAEPSMIGISSSSELDDGVVDAGHDEVGHQVLDGGDRSRPRRWSITVPS